MDLSVCPQDPQIHSSYHRKREDIEDQIPRSRDLKRNSTATSTAAIEEKMSASHLSSGSSVTLALPPLPRKIPHQSIHIQHSIPTMSDRPLPRPQQHANMAGLPVPQPQQEEDLDSLFGDNDDDLFGEGHQQHANMAGLPAPQPHRHEDLDALSDDDDDLFGEGPQQQQQHGAGIPGYLVLPPQRNVAPADPFEGLPFGAQQQHGAGIAGLVLPPRPQQRAGMGGLLARFEQDVDLAGLIAQHPAATAPETAMTPVAQAHSDEYPCVECSEHFASVDDRAAHMRTAHNIEDGFLCHECPHSCSDRMQYVRHANEHSASRRRGQYHAPCRSVKCEHRSFSADVLDRHRREDHAADDSHQAQCSRPECTYSNDSIVGVSVHILHVHSEAAVANRRLAAERKSNEQMFARRRAAAARKAALREAAARAAASYASSDTVPSSPIESIEGTGDNASSATAGSSTKKRPLSPEEQERADEAAANSNAFLEAQMAAHKSQTPEELEQFGLNCKERKKFKVREKKAQGKK